VERPRQGPGHGQRRRADVKGHRLPRFHQPCGDLGNPPLRIRGHLGALRERRLLQPHRRAVHGAAVYPAQPPLQVQLDQVAPHGLRDTFSRWASCSVLSVPASSSACKIRRRRSSISTDYIPFVET